MTLAGILVDFSSSALHHSIVSSVELWVGDTGYASQIRDWLHIKSPFQDSLRIAGDDWWRGSIIICWLQRKVMLLKTWVGCKEWGKAFWVGEAPPPTQRFKNIPPALISLSLLSLSAPLLLSSFHVRAHTHAHTHTAHSPCLFWLSPLSALKEQSHLFMFPADESSALWWPIHPRYRCCRSTVFL